jgi:hypothetical protein
MAGVRDFMRGIDARLYAAPVVHAVARFGTDELQGAFFDKPREVSLPNGGVMGLAISFECQYDPAIATLNTNDLIAVDDYGSFRFLREIQPGGDESGKTIMILGEVVA